MFLNVLLIIIALCLIVLCFKHDVKQTEETNYGIMKKDIEERLKQKHANN